MASRRTAQAMVLWCLLTPFAIGQQQPARRAASNPQLQEHLRKAQQALQGNEPEEAAREFLIVLAIDPHHVEARASLGMIAFLRGDFETAATYLQKAIKQQPALWEAQALLGISLKRTGDILAARTLIEKAFPNLNAAPKLRIKCGMELVEIHFQMGELEKAAAVISELKRLAPGDADILYADYHVYSKLAERALASMISAAPQSARMHQVIAQRRATAGDIKGALEHYQRAIKADAQLPGVHFEYGQALLLATDTEDALGRARAEFEASLATNPRDPIAERQLGEVFLRLADYEAAVKHFSCALELKPDDADAHFGIGKAYASAGDLNNAAIHLEAVTRLDAGNALVYYRLGNVYQRLGRAADADRAMGHFEQLRDAQRADAELYRKLGVPSPRPQEQQIGPDEP